MEYLLPFERRLGMSQEPYGLALNGIQLARETGWDTQPLQDRLDALIPTIAQDQLRTTGLPNGGVIDIDVAADETELRTLLDEIPDGPPSNSPYFEASDWASIDAALPAAAAPDQVHDREGRTRGAWYGRVAGNMLGKPIEGAFTRAKLTRYLTENDALPLTDYVPLPDPTKAPEIGFWSWEGMTRGRVDGGVRDDDIDYTVLGLHLLETHGREYSTFDVAAQWLTRFPLLQLYTAERAVYNNLLRGIPLDQAGEVHNPYREWIGALIRGDVFGYAFAGDPRSAARLAYRDAYLSHRANGIYGEMWAAALIATAFTASSPTASIRASLDHIPTDSRLAHEIRAVVDDHEAGLDWDIALDRLDDRHPGMSWVHTINNAGALTAAILWGDGDYTRTIALAVRAGLDTDSIGATAGSWAGAFVGIDGIPAHWIDPLHDRTACAIVGFEEVRISDLVRRTLALEIA